MQVDTAKEPEWMRKERLILSKATTTRTIPSKKTYSRKNKAAEIAAFHLIRKII